MDESWRCTMGSVLPRQRSSDQHHGAGAGGGHLDPDDFRDVYGGPPRTVLLRSFAGEGVVDYHSPTSHHHQYMNYGGGAEAAFCRRPYAGDGGRAAAAAVPTEQGFFDDIFGARRRQMRSRSRSNKSKSSSAVSSDELPSGFCRPVITAGGRNDPTLSSFTSRLRPVTIPSRRYDSSPPTSTSTIGEYQSSFTCSTAAYPAARYYYGGDANKSGGGGGRSSSSNRADAGEGRRRRHQRGSSNFCCFTSNPETSSNAPSFRRGTTRGGGARWSPAAETTITDDYSAAGADDDYGYYYSPPSATSSSLFTNPMAVRTPRRLEEVVMEVRERAPLLMDDGDDIDSVGAAAVDEAIAWAKERFWSQAR